MNVYFYNSDSLSVKVPADLNMAETQWDFLFDYILARTNHYYFLGDRLECSNKDLETLLESVLKSNSQLHFARRSVLMQLKPASLILSRKQAANLWQYYEYPSLIFSKNEVEKELVTMFQNDVSFKEIVGALPQAYLIHRNIELNVLWIRKSPDFPLIDLFI